MIPAWIAVALKMHHRLVLRSAPDLKSEFSVVYISALSSGVAVHPRTPPAVFSKWIDVTDRRLFTDRRPAFTSLGDVTGLLKVDATFANGPNRRAGKIGRDLVYKA